MTAPGTFTPYSTIAPLLGTMPGWVQATEQQRVASYLKYEQIYWSSEEGFVEILRGDNENPIFLPLAKTLVDTINRYTAPDLTYTVTPNALGAGSEADVRVANLALEALFAREEWASKFEGNKRSGIIKGDWLFHLMVDTEKPLGKRLRLMTPGPETYFPVYDIEDPERILAVHLAELQNVNGQQKVSRMTYEKVFNADGSTGILRSHGIFELAEWWVLTKTPEAVILPSELLPAEITSIPVYHLKNFDPTAVYGSSQLRGLESVLVGLNQSISDEDLALAMDGIGVYATDGRGPVDERGNETDWIMGPGRVLTQANGLKRVNGVGSVAPYGDHLERLERAAKESVGASDVAVGAVDAATAESGIALAIRLGPILAETGKKDVHIVDKVTQLYYDLITWLAVFEELPLLNGSGAEAIPKVLVTPVIGPKIPTNLKQTVETVVALRNLIPPAVSMATTHALLRAAGLALPDNELALLAEEAAGPSLDPLAEPLPGDEALVDEELAALEEEPLL